MKGELLGYTTMDGVELTHLAPVHTGGLTWNLALKPLCHNVIPRARIQLGAETEDWKKAEASYRNARDAYEEWRHEFGLCPKCMVRIEVLARKEGALIDAAPKEG